MKILLLVCLLLLPQTAFALRPTTTAGVAIYGAETIPPEATATVRFFLTQMPRDLYAHLRFITIGDFPLLRELARDCRVIEGYGTIGCGINTFPGSAIYQTERPFPDDSPDAGVTVDLFYGALGHELTHQISQQLGHRWHNEPGPPVGSPDYPVDRGFSDWPMTAINDAGCEPRHYLRSMLPPCFFRDAPQELLASIGNQWLACSECTLRLGLTRWDAGIPQPMQQVALAILAWSSHAGTSFIPRRMTQGVIHAYRYRSPGVAEHELWTVYPWRCGGDVTISGPTFSLTVTLNDGCRVTAVGSREGI